MRREASQRIGVAMAEGEPIKESGVAPEVPVPAPESEPELPQIDGFRVIQDLGRSPHGHVYRARRLVEQDVVAVKLFRGAGTHSPKFREHLTENAETSFLLEHPHLVRCLGCVEDGARFMLVQELAKGEPLSRALQRSVRFMPPRSLDIVRQCAEGLAHAAERRRYHGRLHPGDLMQADDEVRILGVGLGEQPEHPGWETRDPHLFEPLIYTATEALPSQSFPTTDAERRALDLYALGGLLYHMLTGTPPFRGGDEDTLIQERAALSPLVVRWPRGTERSLPVRAITLVERLLSPDPMARGDYQSLLRSLTEAIREAHGEALPPPPPQMTPPLAPVEIPVHSAPPPAKGPLAGAGLPPAPLPYPTAIHAPPTRRVVTDRERSPLLLILAVAVVLAYALGLATKTFLLTHSEAKDEQNAQASRIVTEPKPEPDVPPDPKPEPGLPRPVEWTPQQERAAHELKLLKELIAESAVKYDRPLLRALQEIADKAGEGSKTGIEAQLLMAEVKERLARAGTVPATTDVKATTEVEERVFSELLERVRGLTGQQRYGDALAILKELPAPLKLAPYPERATQEAAQIERMAKAEYAKLGTEADQAMTAGDYPKARGLYQAAQVRWGLPQMAQAAEERVKEIVRAEEKAFQARAELRAQKTRANDQRELAVLLRSVVGEAFEFRYREAGDALEKFVRAAQDPEMRGLAQAYAQAIRDENGLFDLCRQRLGEKIQRDKVSPLQVLSSADRKPLYDIIDFDLQGIRITAVRGSVGGEMLRVWKDWNPKQPFVMLQILADKASPSERLSLAVLAFHQSLRAEALAGESAKEADKANEYRRTAVSLKSDADDELNGSVRIDPGVRERQVALRAMFQRIAELLANPPPAP
jgi:serine/threonine-protein kinase